MYKLFRRLVIATVATTMLFAAASMTTTPEAHATAQTCTSAKQGGMCTTVQGSGTHVERVYSIYEKIIPTGPLFQVCNIRAWFFEITPSGKVNDLGIESRDGCQIATRVWLSKPFDRDFPAGSKLCTKFYEDNWQELVGQRCVGIS